MASSCLSSLCFGLCAPLTDCPVTVASVTRNPCITYYCVRAYVLAPSPDIRLGVIVLPPLPVWAEERRVCNLALCMCIIHCNIRMQSHAIQYRTVHYNAIQCNTMQYSAIQCNGYYRTVNPPWGYSVPLSDLIPLNGVQVIASYVGHDDASCRLAACDIIGTSCQNNPRAQAAFRHTLPSVMDLVGREEENGETRSKALYAVSCKCATTC